MYRPCVLKPVALVSLCVLLVACGKEAPSASTTKPVAPGKTGTARITGTVVLEGAAPAPETVRVSSDSFCMKSHPEAMDKGDLVLGEGKTIANVFVWVKEGVTGRYPVPAKAVVLDQRGCQYEPRVFGVMTGQGVTVHNSDETLHNVHVAAKVNKPFNRAMHLVDMQLDAKFEKAEVMVKVKCDVHGWMTSWMGVVPHPFFAVTGRDGTFAIEGLPAGTYTVEAWHERLGVRTLRVTLAEAEARTAPFSFTAPAP